MEETLTLEKFFEPIIGLIRSIYKAIEESIGFLFVNKIAIFGLPIGWWLLGIVLFLLVFKIFTEK